MRYHCATVPEFYIDANNVVTAEYLQGVRCVGVCAVVGV